MSISRRGFLKALGASVAVVAAGPVISAVQDVETGFLLEDQCIVLDRPLVLRGEFKAMIRRCEFSASEKFPTGNPLIHLIDCSDSTITDCKFTMP